MAQKLPEALGPKDAGADIVVETSHLITEDGAPVDSFLAEKQMRLLTETLYTSWKAPEDRPFLVAANVGVFAVPKNTALVPDVFLALDTPPFKLTGDERQRSYFVWDFGKPPDVVIEIVSDTPGGELSDRLRGYERMRTPYYVVFDPLHQLSGADLVAFSLQGDGYVQATDARFDRIGLGLVVWDGEFEGVRERWLRWCDAAGLLVPTGAEQRARADRESARAEQESARAEQESTRAEQESARAEQEAARAEQEAARAEQEAARAERLAAKLRALGIEDD